MLHHTQLFAAYMRVNFKSRYKNMKNEQKEPRKMTIYEYENLVK